MQNMHNKKFNRISSTIANRIKDLLCYSILCQAQVNPRTHKEICSSLQSCRRIGQKKQINLKMIIDRCLF